MGGRTSECRLCPRLEAHRSTRAASMASPPRYITRVAPYLEKTTSVRVDKMYLSHELSVETSHDATDTCRTRREWWSFELHPEQCHPGCLG